MFMAATKTVTINDILSSSQIVIAWNKWTDMLNYKINHRQFHEFLRTDLIVPNLPAINLKLGQENDPSYLAYVVEYVFIQTEGINPT